MTCDVAVLVKRDPQKVEAYTWIEEMLCLKSQIMLGGFLQALLFFVMDGGEGFVWGAFGEASDFDEYDNIVILRDDVDLTATTGVVAGEDGVSL